MPEKQVFNITLRDSRTVRVEYEPLYISPVVNADFKGSDHFSFYGDAISETGYKSEFIFVDKRDGAPEEMAKIIAQELADELDEKITKTKVVKTTPQLRMNL